MSISQMSTKERMMAAINMEPVDRIPFWPKLGRSYPPARKGNQKNWSVQDFNDYLDCDIQSRITPCIRIKRTNTSYEEYKDGNRTIFKYQTPYGEAKMVWHYDKASCSHHPIEHPIKTIEDVKIMAAFYNDAEVSLDEDVLEENHAAYEEIGDRAMVAVTIGESPLMYLIEYLAGVANAHYLLFDEQETIEELFEAQHKHLCQTAKVLAKYSPADIFYMVENTSTTLINPDQYAKYCFKHINDYGDILNSHGRILTLHMCGHLKGLLPQLAKTPAKVFEAFTSPPVGNTSFYDGRSNCPDKCLIGGTNAALWMQPVDNIIAQIKHDLDILPHHRGIIVSPAGVMPPSCELETIKEVCDFIQNYQIDF